MNQILVDTNAYVAFKRGDPGALNILRGAERVGISVIAFGELLSGFAFGSREAEVLELTSRDLGQRG